jgi:hypothetical protein
MGIKMNSTPGQYDAEYVCDLYWRTYFYLYKGFRTRKMKNFDKHRNNPKKWIVFEKMARIANKHHINLHEYVNMVGKQIHTSGKYFSPNSLLRLSNLNMWRSRQLDADQTIAQQTIVDLFTKSVKFIVSFCVKNNIPTFSEYLKISTKTGTINMHIASGRLSKYVLCFISEHTLHEISKHIDPDISYQLQEMVIQNRDALLVNTYRAMFELKGASIKNISKLIDKNIVKHNSK